MFSNILEEKRYIQEVVDPETNKHYNVHITICDDAPFFGFIAFKADLTDPSPYTGILVEMVKKAYPKMAEEFLSKRDMFEDFEKILQDSLPYGIKRFEAIMANGIKGNELPD